MLQDKMRETDWEVTQETIEEQVARESYLQWLKDNEKRAKRQASVSSGGRLGGDCHLDGLVQERRNSISNAPSICSA